MFDIWNRIKTIEIKTTDYFKFVEIFVLMGFFSIMSPAQDSYDYTINVGNEQLRFVPQPEKGYVVKQAKTKAEISALAGILFLEEGRIQPIGGIDRHGICIVENDGPASKNNVVMSELVQNGAAEYAAPLFSSNGETVAIIPEIVIRVHPGVDTRQVDFLCKSMALAVIKPMEFTTQEYLLQVLGPDADAVFTALEKLKNIEWIEWAAPNTASQPKLFGKAIPGDYDFVEQLQIAAEEQDANSTGVFPNDEYFPRQWHLHNTGQSGGIPGVDIRAPEAWDITTGDPNIVVAVIDTGVDTKHPDLVGNLVAGYDFYDNDDQPNPALHHPNNTHGTACAGLIAAQGNNAIGVSGAAWNCKVMPIRWESFASDGKETWVTDSDVAQALRWAAAHRADILSNSWGLYAQLPATHSAIMDVTRRGGIGRDGKGCLVFSCAMNFGKPISCYPQKYPEVIVVGATDHNDARCYYSDYGPELDIVAPSGPGCTNDDWLNTKGRGWTWTTDISGPAGWNMDPFDPNILDYTGMGGTSGACPVAAGVAALILSVEPNLTNNEVRYFLERSAKDLGAYGRDVYYGWGRVDARAALDMVLAKRADLNNDWKVDFRDFAVLAQCWKTDDLRGDIGPIPRPDGAVDVQDLAFMGAYWLTETPDPNLLAHWNLDETEGTIAHDSINNKNGTLNSGPIWQPAGGKVNGALQLDGTNDCVSTPFILNPSSSPFTAVAWVKGGVAGQVVLSQQSSILFPQGKDWLCTDPTGGKLMTALTDGSPSTSPLVSESVITDGEWHCIGVTWDGSRRRLYADGAKVAEDLNPLTNLVSSDKGLYLGAGKTLTTGTFWSGLIDDVRIYNRVVSP